MVNAKHSAIKCLGKQTFFAFEEVPLKIKRKKKSAAEYHLQVACVRWFDLAYPEFKLKFFHIPNQSIGSNAKAGKFLKEMGRRAGVLDCLLAVKNGDNCGMFIDFKSKGGKLSEAQTHFIEEMVDEGYQCVEVTSLDQFIYVISGYLGKSKRFTF